MNCIPVSWHRWPNLSSDISYSCGYLQAVPRVWDFIVLLLDFWGLLLKHIAMALEHSKYSMYYVSTLYAHFLTSRHTHSFHGNKMWHSSPLLHVHSVMYSVGV